MHGDAFNVVRTIIAEYISQDIQGKWIFAGVYTDDIIIVGPRPGSIQPFFIVPMITAPSRATTFYFCVKDDEGALVLSSSGEIEAASESFQRSPVLPIPIQVPSMLFRGNKTFTVFGGADEKSAKAVHDFAISHFESFEVADRE